MTPLSQYYSLEEAIKSQTATRHNISNAPTEEHLENMKYLAEQVLDRVCAHFKVKIPISSFYRSFALNKAVGGSTTSQHSKGEAADLDADTLPNVSNAQVFHYIKDNLDFDQLIWEFGNSQTPDWVHVSKKTGTNRRQVLKAVRSGGKTVYEPWRG
jgi:zinc D-Ala-D-Ala carboxypeptidase